MDKELHLGLESKKFPEKKSKPKYMARQVP